jgi:hypothetical protein
VRALSGNGAGQIGFLLRWVGASLAVIRFPEASFPHDIVKKQVRTIAFLCDVENAACEARYATPGRSNALRCTSYTPPRELTPEG